MHSISLLAAGCAVFSTLGFGQQLVSGPVVVFLGAPGSGKSTQAAAAAKYLKVPVVSAAELVRDNADELRKVYRHGITGIVPETDPLLNKFFQARLNKGDLSGGMILDGYPNTKDQADFASKLVASGVVSKPIILHLQVPDDVVRKRLAGKDGKLPSSAEQRLKDYHREVTAIEIYFPNADVTLIDGTKKPGAVTKKVNAVLKAKFGK
jgi:adenylate kinase